MDEVQNTFKKNMSNLSEAVKDFPWENPLCYAQWVRDSFEYVNHSTRILAHAAAVMPSQYSLFSNRFIAHAHEEQGHEKLLVRDLEHLGYKIDELPPSLEMQFFYQSLYYWLSHHGNVMGLFGWIFTLEGAAVEVGDFVYELVDQVHGRKAAHFLKVHSSEDPDHLEKAFKTVEALSSEDREVVIKSLNQYCSMYCLLLDKIKVNSMNEVKLTA